MSIEDAEEAQAEHEERMNEVVGTCPCGEKVHRYEMSRHCGAFICGSCGHHIGLARCFCGWAADGGNGYRQLIEDGETIEPEDY